ncbi:hypothetical protein EVAR_67035_1 [Eumeta japonica]|uniref:G-protein coupled receptors family 1 profile domain-containing protein n=1 Tax=Eumeta variegata TaxID=151549 RepID=A0A4C2A3D6_EUMVA|nr:hypothetical protein EVAR_67035_1 [Eumeta japonica]
MNAYYDNSSSRPSTLEVDRQFWDYFDNAMANDTKSASVLPDEVYSIEYRDQRPILATYGVLLVMGGLGNLFVLTALAKSRRRKSRVDMMMTHLAVADVTVTCGVIPLEGRLVRQVKERSPAPALFSFSPDGIFEATPEPTRRVCNKLSAAASPAWTKYEFFHILLSTDHAVHYDPDLCPALHFDLTTDSASDCVSRFCLRFDFGDFLPDELIVSHQKHTYCCL